MSMNTQGDKYLTRIWRGKPVRRMHVMVKPTGALCNLDCTYCYYLSKQELLGKPEQWRISDEVLETFIRQYFEGQNYKEVVFSWQGGEPTLLGLDFFQEGRRAGEEILPVPCAVRKRPPDQRHDPGRRLVRVSA